MTEQNKPIRVGVIGTGMISLVHLRAIRSAGAQVVGILGVDRPAVEELSKEYSATACEDFEQLLQTKPQVIHVVTPNATHYDYVMDVIGNGCHVVCEKPLGINVEQAGQMADAAKKAGLVAVVPFAYRYHPLVRRSRQLVSEGTLGSTFMVHGSYLQDWMLPPEAGGWRVEKNQGGASRAYADIGSHWFDLAEWVSGMKVQSLQANMQIVYKDRPKSSQQTFATNSTADTKTVESMRKVDTEDIAVVTGTTDSGALLNSVISQVSAGRKNRLWLEVDGTEGSVVFDQEQPETIWVGGLEHDKVLHRGANPIAPDYLPAGHPQGYQDCFNALIADTYRAIQGQEVTGLPTFEDGLRAVELAEAVIRSVETNGDKVLVQGDDIQ